MKTLAKIQALFLIFFCISCWPKPKEGFRDPIKLEVAPGITIYNLSLNNMSWGPDNIHIVGEDNRWAFSTEVYIWNMITREYTLISDGIQNYIDGSPAWSPDGSRIVYYSTKGLDDLHLLSVNLETMETTPFASGSQASWFPDNSKVAIKTRSSVRILDIDPNNSYTIWSMHARGSNYIRKISVSPAGNYIAVLLNNDLVIIPMNGDEVYTLYSSLLSSIVLDWSPDEQWVIVEEMSSEPDGLIAIQTNSTCVTDLLTENDLPGMITSEFAWSPDNSTIVVDGNHNEIRGAFFIDTTIPLIQDWLSSGTCGN